MSKKTATVTEPTVWDVVVAGSGPAGLAQAALVSAQNPEASILILEASDRTGGRALSGLHLVPANSEAPFGLRCGPKLGEAKIRWERQWVSPAEVDWTQKDWAARLPQWDLYFGKAMKPVLQSTLPTPEACTLKLSSPVSRLTRSTDTSVDGWQLETPAGSLLARRVVWAAGITAFQNAYGKFEANALMVANPVYEMVAADFRGGVSLSLTLANKPHFEEGFPEGTVFGLPFRHAGKLYLLIGALFESEGTYQLETLAHINREALVEPAEIMSFQKSMRRALKGLLVEGAEDPFASSGARWVVSDRVGGHMFGSLVMFGQGEPGSLDFVGDECQGSATRELQDTSGTFRALGL
ncbi:MAG: NAD(P)-binding protein [Bdellovibrionales bacterium]|nr:NAD(P)-binding protein [Bdellovibrionales bacterium]